MIHKYTMNGYRVVLDVYSGAVHVVDPVVYDMLDYYGTMEQAEIADRLGGAYPEDEIAEGYAEIEHLVNEGTLFAEDEYAGLLEQVAERGAVVKALCLLVSHDCNLKCEYCFAEEGEYHTGGRGLMSLETGKAAVDFLISASVGRKSLEIDFFGGEPLMNMDAVRGIVAYAQAREGETGKRFRFTMTTNGVLLDQDKLDFINRHMENLVISLDGRRDTNDRVRKRRDGGGSYDLLLPRLKAAADSRDQDNYYIRGTFTRYNTDFANDVLHLADEGFKQISIEPVVGDESAPYALREEDLPAIYAEYERLAVEMLRRGSDGGDFNFFHFMIDLTGGPCVAKRLSGCGAGSEYLAVAANGDLYPCHQFAGIDGFRMGSVAEGVRSPGLRKAFESRNVYTNAACRDCWAKFYCSGGCAANAHTLGGGLDGQYELGCKLQRKRTECAIMIKAAEAFGADNTSKQGS